MAATRGPSGKILQGIVFIARFSSHEKLILSIECLRSIALSSPPQKKGAMYP
jgi:hypothetical protein